MLDERIMREQVDALASAMLTLSDVQEARCFFEDLLTVGELQAISQRLAVARLLRRGTTYQEIAERTGASTATISRVNRSLHYGAGGYRRVLAKLEAAKPRDESENGEDQ